MGTIQSSVGLVTGVPIQDTVDQLISISAQPRDRLQARTNTLQQERIAITELTALSIGLELASTPFGSAELFASTAAQSSNSSALSVVRTEDDANTGDIQARVLQLAQTHSFSSQRFGSTTESLGFAGKLRIGSGGYIDRSVELADLNSGRGVERGSIQVTDRSGATAVVDLSNATTITDVVNTISEATGIRVSASTDGDRIVLTDLSGQSSSNLRVTEVGGGSTAADLGLNSIDVAANSATGFDVFSLGSATSLNSLRDGRGIDFAAGNDIDITLSDGTNISVDFDDFSKDETAASGTTDNTNVNSQVTISSVATGGSYDGVQVAFVDDASVTQGNETVEFLEGSFGRQLVFHIDEGSTTADDIASALAADSTLSALFTATAGGTGAGTIDAEDTTTITGGAAISARENPTVQDLLRVLNDQNANLQASLSTSGDGIELTDLSGGGGNFVIADSAGSSTATNLGIVADTASATVTGSAIHSGLQSVSLDALNGGNGLGPLGSLSITTRDGASASVDLSGASTVQDVLRSINDSGLDVVAGYNQQGTGIQIRDLSGGTTSSLQISSVDDTASLLEIEVDINDSLAVGGHLGAQSVSRNTSLANLNQGQGITSGSFTISDSSGATGAVNLTVLEANSVGDIIDAVNDLGIGVTASINSDGDGIQLIDTAGGGGSLTVTDSGSGTAASDLRIAGTSESQLIDGEVVDAIVGSESLSINVTADDTIATISQKISDAGSIATATLSDGRLEIRSLRGGEAGRLTVDTQGFDLGFRQTSSAQDALLEIGQPGTAVLYRSTDNVFADAVTGLSFTAKEVSTDSISITVSEDTSAVVNQVDTFVSQYNRLVDRLDELTAYDAATQVGGLLFGSNEAIRIQGELGNLLTGSFRSAGSIRSLGEIGLRLNDQGKLNLDTEKLTAKLTSDRAAVEEFFTTEDTGLSAKIKASVDKLAGDSNSLLLRRSETLTSRIDQNNDRITTLNGRLSREETRLLNQFFAMESAIASLQSNQNFLSSIVPITRTNS